MRCSYGDRGSLTAICVNATSQFIRSSTYRFDNLDETVICLNCTLDVVESNSFDLAGNLIKNLILDNSKITRLRESSFIGLVFLEKLVLSNNQIKEIIPLTFRGIKKLITLDLENNSIGDVQPNSYKELINLEKLNLKNNAIQKIDPNGFSGLIKLRELNLQNNHIYSIKDAFGPLIAIESINLEQNKISDIHVYDMNCSTLIELILSKNSLRNIGNNVFDLLYNLRLLDLSWNAIDTLNDDAFKGLSNLTQLDLDSNMLTSIPKTVFKGMKNLRYLRIASNSIKEFKSGTFSALPELRSLNISSNKIKSVESAGVIRLYSLHTFDISHNTINDIDYRFLIYVMPKLSHLSIIGNRLPCYLISEINEFFANDNIDIEAEIYDKNNCTIVNPSLAKNVSVDLANSIAKEFISDNLQRSHNAAMYSLFTILLILICILFFIQYRVYKALSNMGVNALQNRTVSRVQLVNDYENNESELYNNK